MENKTKSNHYSKGVPMKNSDRYKWFYKMIMRISIAGILAGILSSCVSSTSFVQSALINGPAQKNTIRITENIEQEKFSIRWHFARNMQQEIHTSASEVNEIVSSNVTPPFIDLTNNVHWRIPQSEILFDLEIALSPVIVAFGGMNIGMMDKTTAVGKTIGIGFRRKSGHLGVRLDISYNIQDMDYEVTYVNRTEFIWGDVQENVIYDAGTMTSNNFGLGVTLNTVKQEGPVNLFLHGGYGSQTIIEPGETSFVPDPPSYADNYINLAGGLFFHLGHNHRFLIGYGLNNHKNERGKAPWVSFLIVQFDLVF